MAEYIPREALKEVVCNVRWGKHLNKDAALNLVERAIDNLPAADVVEVDKVAEMLCYALSDECPCNYSPTDEWLPEVCELQDECPNPKDPLGCWKQFIKHYRERSTDRV